VANTEVYVLDERQELKPLGVAGEIYLGGAGLARGYLNRPDLTAERFLPHPYSLEPGARLYRTGDLGRMREDGNLEFIGRVDHQVKVRGYRIELGEVEAVLREHPEVQVAVVLAAATAAQPPQQQLVGYVVAAPETQPTAQQLRSYLKERLPAYMVPAQLVLLAELPLTAHAKVDRKALAALVLPSLTAETDYVAPTTELEQRVAAIWQEVLAVDKVGLTDNFFDLGGHSLLITKLISRLRRDFHIEIPLLTIFRAPTVAEQVEVINLILWTATLANQTSVAFGVQENITEGEL
jgi:acyl carrier protein